ncbi:MAG: hypothetical protein IJS79_00240 [Oscillospiraceae bacterium]|nr:hypothetical protein [Oscillospiraceae bacterium]
MMFSVGEKIIYGENGVCTVEKIGSLPMDGAGDRMYYHLTPLIGSGTYFTPVDSAAYMRPVMTRSEAEAFIATIPGIEPAICSDTRFNHVDAFYKELFKLHSCEALVSVIKGLYSRMADRKTKSSRAEATMKRAKDILHGELAVALDIDISEVESYIAQSVAAAK